MAARSQREKDHMKDKNQVILAEMLKEESNKYCSDCGAKGPRWASWNLGVFLCIRCAGIHRNLGVHISKVKSVNLDSWTPDQMANIQDWGNRRAGLYWECFLPKDFHRPQTNSAVETFIRNKYEHKKYVKKDGIPPKPASKTAPSSSNNKPEKVIRKKKDEQIIIPKIQETAKKTTTTTAAPRPKPQPSAAPAPAPVKANPPSMDLLSLDNPEPAVSQPPAKPAQQTTSLADELIDFGAFQSGPQSLSPTTSTQPQQQPQQQQELASLSQNTTPANNEEPLLKDDTATSKSTKDSIMALFGSGGASSSHQQQMYGVPGGMYISPQQQPTPHNMMNGPRMQTGPYHQQHQSHNQLKHQTHNQMHHQTHNQMHHQTHNQMHHQTHNQMHHQTHNQMHHQTHNQMHHQTHNQIQHQPRQMMPMHMQQQQRLMQHAPPHQQHAQLSQMQNHMQNLKLQNNPQLHQTQQPNQFNMYNANKTMFNQQAMSSLMTNQHVMNYQQQQPQFVSTGPVNNAYPMGAMPSTGHTFNNQLWK